MAMALSWQRIEEERAEFRYNSNVMDTAMAKMALLDSHAFAD
jgi:hypothetical protein